MCDDDLDDHQCVLCTDEKKRMKKAQSFEHLASMALRGQVTSEEIETQTKALTEEITKKALDFTKLGI